MMPLKEEKLFSVLDRAAEKLKQNERCLNLELSGEIVRIPFYQIRYLDVHQNYATVHAQQDYTVKRTLGDFEKELHDRFFRAVRDHFDSSGRKIGQTRPSFWGNSSTRLDDKKKKITVRPEST